jgi:hypothetical protein
MDCRVKPGNDDVRGYPALTSSLRGAAATKQSSFPRKPAGLLRCRSQ